MEGSNLREQFTIKGLLRFASFALPSAAAILVLLICWRQHFNKRSVEGAGLMMALCVYMARFMNRRSRGLPAAFFYASNGPDREESTQEDMDVIALLGAAVIAGMMAYMLFKYW
jgi:hypothetical protein